MSDDGSALTPKKQQTKQTVKNNWSNTAQHIVFEISELFTLQYHLHTKGDSHAASQIEDFNKLLQAAEKLEQLTTKQQQDIITDKAQLWHKLRNIIGTIQGYVELIQEEQSPSPKISYSLNTIFKLSNELLELGESSTLTLAPISLRTKRKSFTGTILIVDDQPESREILRRHLQQDNHRVIEAASGKEMLSVISETEIDLILLDLILPEMDGHYLLAKLKKHELWRSISVIVVSGSKDMERVVSCIEAGAEDYLFKPFNPVLLQARIYAGIERKRWHQKEALYRQELERNHKFIRHTFGRYVSEDIVDQLLEKPKGLDLGGKQCKVSIMMADIRGFTPIAERLSPQNVVRLLNHYLGAMSDIIMNYGGTVNEFIGDGILAIFGAPTSGDDDADRAIACALEMQAAIPAINQQNLAAGLPAIKIGISINTGSVIAGNIGSLKRTKYGVVGHAVNQTARIEDACPAGKILISESTLLETKQKPNTSKPQQIKAKGIHEAITVYEIIATPGGKP